MKIKTITEQFQPPEKLPDLRKRMDEIVRKKAIAHQDFTEEQIADAFIQALPDFTLYVARQGQSVTYIPGQEAHRLRVEIEELKKDLQPILLYMATMRFGADHGPPTERFISPFFKKYPDLDPGF